MVQRTITDIDACINTDLRDQLQLRLQHRDGSQRSTLVYRKIAEIDSSYKKVSRDKENIEVTLVLGMNKDIDSNIE